MTRGSRILPGRTSGASARLTTPGAVRPSAALGGESIDLADLARVADRHDPLGLHRGDLVEPTLIGDAVTVVIAGQRHGLPAGVELSPGGRVTYLHYRDSIYALVSSGGRIMQLNPDRELAERIRAVHFQK